MDKPCHVVLEGAVGEIVEKKSRFIATVIPVHSEEEAIQKRDEIKKNNWDARHNCFAYIIGTDGQLMRSSDDGEPQGTAGHPMLDVLMAKGLHDVLVVVTRYFGGVLLGTGGLVRAYQQAVKEGLSHSVLAKESDGVSLSVNIDYTNVGRVQYIMGEMNIEESASQYTDKVSIEVVVAKDKQEQFVQRITQETSGKANVEVLENVIMYEKFKEEADGFI